MIVIVMYNAKDSGHDKSPTFTIKVIILDFLDFNWIIGLFGLLDFYSKRFFVIVLLLRVYKDFCLIAANLTVLIVYALMVL